MSDDERLAEVIAFPGFGGDRARRAEPTARPGWGAPRPGEPEAPATEAARGAPGTAESSRAESTSPVGWGGRPVDRPAPTGAETRADALPADAAEKRAGWGRGGRSGAPADPEAKRPGWGSGSSEAPADLEGIGAGIASSADPVAELRERIRRIESSPADPADPADSAAPADPTERTAPADPTETAEPMAPFAAVRGARKRPRVAFVATDDVDSDRPAAIRPAHEGHEPSTTSARARRPGAVSSAAAPTPGPVRPSSSNLTVLPGTSGDAAAIDDATAALVRWLGRAPRSVRDARHFLRDSFDELGALDLDCIIDRMLELGYLDDTALAEQLRDGRFSRRSLGRSAMARELREIGIDDGVIDEVLGDLDRDAEFNQALELARSRARRVSVGDRDTAFRRLHAYLARRGYGGEFASRAVRQALDEQ